MTRYQAQLRREWPGLFSVALFVLVMVIAGTTMALQSIQP